MRAEADMLDEGRRTPTAAVKVWDPMVRIIHWSLAGSFAFAFATAEAWRSAHIAAGYVVAGLLAFRLAWGFLGPRHARFASFVRGPKATLDYLRDTLAFRARRFVGHNPAGGAMVVALLAAIMVIAVTGYMMTMDSWWGVAWVEELHEGLAWASLALIALHVGGVVLASVMHRENLVAAMLTGMKRRDD